MRRFFTTVFMLALLGALAAGGAAWWWIQQPLRLAAPSIDLSIEPGMLPRQVAQAVRDAGGGVDPPLLHGW